MTPEDIAFTIGILAGIVLGIAIALIRHARWCEYIPRPSRYRSIL